MPSCPPELADYCWLVSAQGRERLVECEADVRSLPELTRHLRRELTPQKTHLLLAQLGLRGRAAARFPRSGQMFFTDRALQQATDSFLATYKAQRFTSDHPVIDLGCGIGGDLMALAQRGPTLGVDSDSILVLLARANLQLCSRRDAWAAQGDVNQLSILPTVAVHLDPDRRPGGQRSVRIEHHQPGPDLIHRLMDHPAGLALKLAPATDASHPLLQDAELEWIGHHRQCQQLMSWFGPLARFPGRRVATVLDGHGKPHHLTADGLPPLPLTSEIRRYVVEPAACVLASGLVGELAVQQDLSAITAGGGYLTGDAAVPSVWCSCFKVLDVMPYRLKRLKAWLQSHNVGLLDIKKRGVDVDPAKLLRQLRLSGNRSATLILTHQGPRTMAILAERIIPEDMHDDPHDDPDGLHSGAAGSARPSETT